MDRDDGLVPEGCRILAEYYKETNQALAARKCEWRAKRHRTRARLAQQGQSHDYARATIRAMWSAMRSHSPAGMLCPDPVDQDQFCA